MDTSLAKNIVGAFKNMNLGADGPVNIDQGERALSLLGGSFLLYKSLKNISAHPLMALQGAAAAGLLIYRGTTGICPLYQKLGLDTTDPQAINITETVTVNVPREKVYAFWRDLSNLPRFMTHLKSVTEVSSSESHWVANTPGNLIDLNWKAEITHEEEGSYIGWQSIEGSMIENAGKVTFTDTLNNIGTELHIEINYFPPAGSVGRGITSLFNGVFEKMILQDIRNFKNYVEQADFRNFAGLISTELS